MFRWMIVGAMIGVAGCGSNEPAVNHETSTTPAVPTVQASSGIVADQPPFFIDVTAESGLSFLHSADGAEQYFFPAIMAGGAAIFDLENDGDADILLLNSRRPFGPSSFGPSSLVPDSFAPNGAEPDRPTESVDSIRHGLFRQEADGRFVDVTPGSGLVCLEYSTGVAAADVNNDGLIDLYVTAFGPDRLYCNQGGGRFIEVSLTAGIANERWGSSAAFVDFDRDGWLDLYVSNYVEYDPGHPCAAATGQQDFCNPAEFPRTADVLYRNVSGVSSAKTAGDERSVTSSMIRFQDVSEPAGISLKRGAGLGVLACDFNGDLWPDIAVANDGHANFLWINNRDGSFRDEAVLVGTAYDAAGRGQGSMGLAAGDADNDGLIDLFVTNLEGESNALYLGRDSGFVENSARGGISRPSFPWTGFGTAMTDLDHDGDQDLLIANGRVRRLGNRRTAGTASADRAAGSNRPDGRSDSDSSPRSAALSESAALAEPANAFWNDYAESSAILINQGAADFELLSSDDDAFGRIAGVARGLAAGDFDRDGDIDVLVTLMDQPARLLRNVNSNSGHWLSIRVTEPRLGGRDAIGARVRVVAGGRTRSQWLSGGGSYLTTSEPRLHFGLGELADYESIEVDWPDGCTEKFPGGTADQHVILQHGEGLTP